ncbi:hypothetical protein [Streptomyces sp. 2A115]|uniref:hypothetical protein n=1 Tax=Streptomyces sp. 2A115 TaxID=3457439 RepID=UPI003FD2B04F
MTMKSLLSWTVLATVFLAGLTATVASSAVLDGAQGVMAAVGMGVISLGACSGLLQKHGEALNLTRGKHA